MFFLTELLIDTSTMKTASLINNLRFRLFVTIAAFFVLVLCVSYTKRVTNNANETRNNGKIYYRHRSFIPTVKSFD